jgi:glucosamine-6-phosphate deaminase
MDIVTLKNSEQVAIAGAQQLIAVCRKDSLSFGDVTTFNLDEYLGIRPEDSRSYRSYMQSELFDHIDIDSGNTYLPECAADENPLDVGPRYEEKIRAAGGIDLQVLGIATIMDAHDILLLATGAEKAEAVRQSIEGPVSSMWPASILQMHERVTVLLDEEAASALTRRDYYNWVQDQKWRLLARIENS